MEKMKPLWNFENLTLEDLVSIQNSLQTVLIKKYQEREEKALSDFREAYKKFREILPDAIMYAQAYCEECVTTFDVDLVTLLDKYFNLQ